MPINRYANYPMEMKKRSEKFISTLKVGQKLWPVNYNKELTIYRTDVPGHTAIYFEEQPNAIQYPQPEMFCGPVRHWWRKNVSYRK